jgi:hypothetical protein
MTKRIKDTKIMKSKPAKISILIKPQEQTISKT